MTQLSCRGCIGVSSICNVDLKKTTLSSDRSRPLKCMFSISRVEGNYTNLLLYIIIHPSLHNRASYAVMRTRIRLTRKIV